MKECKLKTSNDKISLIKGASSILLLTLIAVSFQGSGVAIAANPTLTLFPTNVVADIKDTGETMNRIETKLEGVIRELDEQFKTYQEAKCDNVEGDPGCDNLTRQMSQSYLELLNVIESELPAMRESVSNTHRSMQKNLKKQIGLHMTPMDLQNKMTSKPSARKSPGKKSYPNQPTLRGRSGVRLSQRFSSLYNIVSTRSNSDQNSLIVSAADIYLDMSETDELIRGLDQAIQQKRLMLELDQSFGIITPEMQNVVGGIKAVIFGEEASYAYNAPSSPDMTLDGDSVQYYDDLEL